MNAKEFAKLHAGEKFYYNYKDTTLAIQGDENYECTVIGWHAKEHVLVSFKDNEINERCWVLRQFKNYILTTDLDDTITGGWFLDFKNLTPVIVPTFKNPYKSICVLCKSPAVQSKNIKFCSNNKCRSNYRLRQTCKRVSHG